GVAAYECECDGGVCARGVLLLTHGDQEAPGFSDTAARRIEGHPTAPEDKSAADRGEHNSEERHGIPAPPGRIGFMLYGDDSEDAENYQDASGEKRKSEKRHASAALADFQAVWRGLAEGHSSVSS